MDNNNWNFNNTYTKLPKLFYSKQTPIPVKKPKLILFNNTLATSLGIPFELNAFAGNEIPKGAELISQAYAGHQFGYFTMLGDGRAVLLGEQVTPNGERFDIQLKGSGQTSYSRNGDGRAALGPMLREYIISESMYALGVPTTRSLAVVKTGETVQRQKMLTGAILTRVAASHIRVGTFEYASHYGTKNDVRALADYTIERHFPFIANNENKYINLLREVIKRQALLISKWQLLGFIHGVMNTDNMTICGETIDYGPCAFMDTYHPDTVFSSIDIKGRYAYKNQPNIALWNLGCLAITLLPLLHENESKSVRIAKEEVIKFHNIYENYWLSGMRSKLGLFTESKNDNIFIKEFLDLMQKYEADYTNTFRNLTLNKQNNNPLYFSIKFQNWHNRWQIKLDEQDYSKEEVKMLMQVNNPAIIPRNYEVEKALTAAEKSDLSLIHKLLITLKNPYNYNSIQEEYLISPAQATCNYKTYCGT